MKRVPAAANGEKTPHASSSFTEELLAYSRNGPLVSSRKGVNGVNSFLNPFEYQQNAGS